MAAETIGRCRCPLCSSDKARLALSKSQLPVITCNGCQCQLFTRSDRSDELARALLVSEPAAAPAADPAPAPSPEPITPQPRRSGWGMFGGA